MKIVVPLKHNEVPLSIHLIGDVHYLKPEDCIEHYGHEFFAEIGKYYTFTKSDAFIEALENNEDIALIQNTKCFNELNSLKINEDDEVILCKAQHFSSLERQFKQGHPEAVQLFSEVVKVIGVPRELVEKGSCCFHNMMVAKPKLIAEYLDFLVGVLDGLFNPTYTKKYGAYLAERILNFWCIMNRKHIIEKDFTIFDK